METNDDINALFNLKDKTALITGGASGLGLMITEALAKSGAKVIIISRKETNILKARDSILALHPKNSIYTVTGDLSTETEIKKIVHKVKNFTNSIDILVNNSGVSWGAELGKFPYSAWDKVFSVNVSGLFHFTQSLLPLLEINATTENPSKILNIGSVMGSTPYGDGAYSYSASKSAVHHLTRILAKELAKKRITVNALAPGPFVSKMTEFAMNSDKKIHSVSTGVPLGRIGSAKDIAAATLFICGQGGNYITGAIIPVDGGLHISTGPELFENSRNL
jgi:NAD(P)-dependent dehydrogenase (short-subunit alcohol dehydrogenase family)